MDIAGSYFPAALWILFLGKDPYTKHGALVEFVQTLILNRPNLQSVLEPFIFPPEERPGKLVFPSCKNIPVIDLAQTSGPDRTQTIHKIIKASEDFGFFQVINHGVTSETIHNMFSAAKDLFKMRTEEKARLCSQDQKQDGKEVTRIVNYEQEESNYWRDNVRHPCHPVEECIELWPEKPASYREAARVYSVEMRKVGLRLWDLICEGLCLEVGCFGEELTKVQLLSIAHYPQCPDPSLTLGLPKHCDPNLLTLLQEDINGLQVFKDEQWLAIEPLPNAIIVNLGLQLQVISNGRLKAPEHRVVTNSRMDRTTIGNLIYPANGCVIEPAEPLVKASIGPLYRAFRYEEFLNSFLDNSGDAEAALKNFQVEA